jgi:hypothetical protein
MTMDIKEGFGKDLTGIGGVLLGNAIFARHWWISI